MDLGAPVFEQLVLAELLAEPDSVLAPRRRELALRRDLLLAQLAVHCPQWIVRRRVAGSSPGVS